jgi:hypothetical protein
VLTLKQVAVTAVLTASIAMPATAAAKGQDPRNPDRQAPAVQQTQDLRNPDRQAPAVQQTQDLRNPDRRAPETPGQPQDLRNADRRAPGTDEITPVDGPAVTAIELPADRFEWGDAGIGAAGGIGLLAMLVGLTLAVTRRRRGSRIPA